MRFRTTLIVALVAAAFGAYVYLHEVRGGEDRARRRAAAEKLLGIEPASVTAVHITRSGTRFEFERRGDTWIILQPTPAPCDPRLMTAFLDTLATARREDEVGGGDLVRYGLDSPAAQVEIVTGSGTRKLALGRINPLQTLVYVLVDDRKDVMLTTSALLTQSLNNAFGWRDKRMTDVDPERVERMEFRTLTRGSLVVKRSTRRAWHVEGPIAWRVDPVHAQNLLQGLARLECIGIGAEHKVEVNKYGLGNRRFGALLQAADGTALADVVVGFEDGHGAYFGMVPNKPEVFKVDGRLVNAWFELVGEPRDRKALPPFLPEKIDRIRVRTSDDTFELRRLSAIDWKVAASQKVDSTFALAPGSVDGLLTSLATLEVSGYPDPQPPASTYDPASIEVLLYASGEQVSGIEIGTRDPRGIQLIARGPGEPAVFHISPAALLDVPFDLERLKAEGEPSPEGTDRG